MDSKGRVILSLDLLDDLVRSKPLKASHKQGDLWPLYPAFLFLNSLLPRFFLSFVSLAFQTFALVANRFPTIPPSTRVSSSFSFYLYLVFIGFPFPFLSSLDSGSMSSNDSESIYGFSGRKKTRASVRQGVLSGSSGGDSDVMIIGGLVEKEGSRGVKAPATRPLVRIPENSRRKDGGESSIPGRRRSKRPRLVEEAVPSGRVEIGWASSEEVDSIEKLFQDAEGGQEQSQRETSRESGEAVRVSFLPSRVWRAKNVTVDGEVAATRSILEESDLERLLSKYDPQEGGH